MAFVVEFTLGSSMYATMALREIMRSETSASFHTTLSQNSLDHPKNQSVEEMEVVEEEVKVSEAEVPTKE